MIRMGRVFLMAMAGLVWLAGCGTNPLYSELPRTPYGRYQALRGGEPPQEELDSFGNSRPALRARLRPMDRP